jgi:hypothetical protein
MRPVNIGHMLVSSSSLRMSALMRRPIPLLISNSNATMTLYRPTNISITKYLSSSSSSSPSSLSSSSISTLPAPPSDIAESAAKEEAKFAAAVNAEREAAAPLRINNNRTHQSNRNDTNDSSNGSRRSSSSDGGVGDDGSKGISQRHAMIIKWGDRFWNLVVGMPTRHYPTQVYPFIKNHTVIQ